MTASTIPAPSPPLPQAVQWAYLHLLKKTLTRFPVLPGELRLLGAVGEMDPPLLREIRRWAAAPPGAGGEPGFQAQLRAFGADWPAEAETMIGLARLGQLQQCVTAVLRQNVPGDLAETGVWRGGASILMRAVLRAWGDTGRRVWLADSFQGLPRPDPATYPQDRGDDLWTYPELAVSLETVRGNFERYGLLDDQVRFLPGWFRDTLPEAPIDRLAVLRLDGDMYESTIVALRSLYHRVSPGGYVIVDDYGSVPACRSAVDDFRAEAGVSEPIVPVDFTGVCWKVRGRVPDRAGAPALQPPRWP